VSADGAAEAEARRRAELLGILCVVVSALALSLKGILAKWAFAEGVSVTTVLALRYGLALPLMVGAALVIARGPRGLAMAPRDLGLAIVGGLLGYWLAGVLDFTALAMIDVSVERVLLFSFPVFVLLLEALRRRRLPPLRQVVALLIAEAGIVLVMGVDDPELFAANLEGGLFAIGSAFVFALYYMVNQHLGPRLGSARMALGAVLGACLGCGVQFVAVEPLSALIVSGTALACIAAMALFCSVVPFLLITEGIRRVGASRSALISTVGPVATLGLAALLLGESLTATQLAGAALVFAAVLALEGRLPARPWLRRRGPPSPAPGSP